MKRHRHTPEQIVRKLREGDRLLNEGKDIAEVLRHLEIAESTWNRWRAQYGGMKADEAKRLRQLETENARLKKLLAEAELDKAMLKELAEGNFDSVTSRVARESAKSLVRAEMSGRHPRNAGIRRSSVVQNGGRAAHPADRWRPSGTARRPRLRWVSPVR